MALLFFKSERNASLQRIRERSWATLAERDELFAHVSGLEDLKIQEFVWMLGSPDSDVRQLGARLTRRCHDPATVPVLLKEAQAQTRPQVQRLIAKVIAELPRSVLVPALLERLSKGDPSERLRVLDVYETHPDLPDVALVLALLRDADPEVRRRSLTRLSSRAGAAADSRVEERLLSLLEDEDAAIRLLALTCLGDAPSPAARARILALLSDSDPGVQQKALEHLSRNAVVDDAETERELIGLLASDANPVRVAVLKVLLGAADQTAVVRRILLFSKTIPGWARERLTLSLKELGRDLVAPAVALMRDPEPEVRLVALSVAGLYDTPEVLDATLALLDDPDEWIRITAVEQLGRTGDARIVPRLLPLLKEDALRWATIEALGAIGDERALPAMVSLLEDEREETRLEVLNAIQRFGRPEIAPQLQRCALTDPSRVVRDRAHEVLGRLRGGDGGEGAGPASAVAQQSIRIRAAGEVTRLDRMLMDARRQGASDFHLSVGLPPTVRLHGELVPLDAPPVSAGDAETLVREILSPRQQEVLDAHSQVDFCHTIENIGRYRANAYRQRLGLCAVFRVIPTQVPTFHDLGLPGHLADLVNYKQGLIVVAGPSGSGKSTSLAAMVNLINESKRDHILTIEDPIEFVHPMKNSLVNQREVSRHTASFAKALRAALREDPDCIVVGEMRDGETIAMAMSAAETGHLVIATLNTTSAPKTVDRLVESFPPQEQPQVRMMLSESLKCVISQQLLARKDGKGRVACFEVLMNTPNVAALIRDNKTYQLPSAMQIGRAHGIVPLDDALLDLVRRGLVAPETAWLRARKRELFEDLVPDEFRASHRGEAAVPADAPPA